MTDYSIAGSSGTTGLSHWAVPTAAGKLAVVDPSDTTTAPAGSAGSDKWASIGQILGVAGYIYPSGDTSGTVDTAAYNAAVTALAGGPGRILFAAGSFYIKCSTVSAVSNSGVYVDGAGRWATTINAVGAGDVIRMFDTVSTRVINGGGVRGITIDGTGTTGASAGVHIGDIQDLELDVAVTNFTQSGSFGVHFDNRNSWTEQATGVIFVSACATGVSFDHSSGSGSSSTSSYDRAELTICLDQSNNPTFDGVVWNNGANIQNGRVSIYGNMGGSASALTAAALRITGQSPSGTGDTGTMSSLLNMELNVGIECDSTAANGPICLAFGSTSNFVQSCDGALNYVPASTGFQAATNVSGNFDYAGNINNAPGLSSTYVMTTVVASFVDLFGLGPAGPGVLSADANNMPAASTPAGLTGVIQQSQYSATSAVTVANTNAIASLGSLSVPAGDVVAGARFKVTAHGTLSIASASPATLYTLDLRWGGTGGTLITSLHTTTTANSPVLAASSALSNVPVLIEGEVEFRTTTACIAWLRMSWTNSTTAATSATVGLVSITSPVTVTTASTESLSLDWTWGTASSSNTITIASSSFERVA